MCTVHNQIGCLTDIKSHLSEHHINEFDTIEEIIDFQKSYATTRQNIILHHKRLVEAEKEILEEEIPQLKDFIQQRKAEVEQKLQLEIEYLKQKLVETRIAHKNHFQAIINYQKGILLKLRVWLKKLLFKSRINRSIFRSDRLLTIKTKRHLYIDVQFDDAINESASIELKKLDQTKIVIDQVNSSIYGAIGEQLVVKELERLPDDYILINDFKCSFNNPIYHPQGKSNINSIQIDHLLITPSGIFLIETKNWSEHSINNLSLRSPVEQVKRTNFALFKILAGEISNVSLLLKTHHWGAKKIPVRNLIVMINQKPKEEFQFVKVLILGQVLRYINYFEPIFSESETQRIASRLLHLCGKSINTRAPKKRRHRW